MLAHYRFPAPQAIWLCEVLNEEVSNECNINYKAPTLVLSIEEKWKSFLNVVGLTTAENVWPTSKDTQFLPSDSASIIEFLEHLQCCLEAHG